MKKPTTVRKNFLIGSLLIALPFGLLAQDKPNIVIIWGDDIGYWNVSAYNQGMMGYRTPNIDRIAREGAIFTDAYGEQSCTAGRARLHHWSEPVSYRPDKSRTAGAPTLGSKKRTRPSPST